MVVVGMVVAAVAAFVVSSVYYTLIAPVERRALGDALPDRGDVVAWKVVTELLRTTVVAAAFAWLAAPAGLLAALGLALVLWVAFPVVLLTGSVIWERVSPVTAAIHAGDWLLKLLLVAVAVGLLA